MISYSLNNECKQKSSVLLLVDALTDFIGYDKEYAFPPSVFTHFAKEYKEKASVELLVSV